MRHHVFEPEAVDAIVCVDYRDYFGVWGGLPDQVVQCARLEARQRADVKELETRAQPLTVLLNRFPGRRSGVLLSITKTSKFG